MCWLGVKVICFHGFCCTRNSNYKRNNQLCQVMLCSCRFGNLCPQGLLWCHLHTTNTSHDLGSQSSFIKVFRPSYLCRRFKTRECVHGRNTRYKNNLNIPAYKSASGQRTFLYRATSFWNSLPCEIRGCDNLPIFKRHLKEFLGSF